MDSDFWTSRLAAAKRQFTLQHQNHHHNSTHQTSQLDRLNIDDFEVEEEVRPEFPCPYCYEEYDIVSLCAHLEYEHSCESKSSGCPVCSVRVTRDMLSHITLQHAHLFKLQRRRRLRRVAVPNSQALSLLGRDLREAHLQVLLGGSGGGGYRSNTSSSSTAAPTDPFLSSLVLNFPSTEAEEISKSIVASVEETKTVAPQHVWKSSYSVDPSLSYEEREKRIRQGNVRAAFVQDLLVSTLLFDQGDQSSSTMKAAELKTNK